MLSKKCTKCKEILSIEDFHEKKNGCKYGKSSHCKPCKNREAAEWRKNNTQKVLDYKYERRRTSKTALIGECYRSIKSRCTKPGKECSYLYLGREFPSRIDFKEWSLNDDDFNAIFNEWVEAGNPSNLVPTIDRFNPNEDYVFDNMQWVTKSENSTRAMNHRWHGII